MPPLAPSLTPLGAATAAKISSLDQGAARKWGGAKMAKWACRPVAAPHTAGRQARRCARVESVADRPFSASCHLVLFPQHIYEDNKLLASLRNWFIWLVWDRDQVYCAFCSAQTTNKLVLTVSWQSRQQALRAYCPNIYAVAFPFQTALRSFVFS